MGGTVEVSDVHLQAVDLDLGESESTMQGGQKPVLKFESEIPAVQSGEPAIQVEGTELHGRPRTSSRGSFKEWTSHQIKITKQFVSEKLGSGTRTVDSSLEARIESLRDTQRKYSHLISLASQFKTHFTQVVEIQKALAEQFAFLSVRTTELHNEFSSNSEAQKSLARSGEGLLAAIKHFLSSFHTMCSKTMEDTLQTVKLYESARLNYDAYRAELESLMKQVQTNPALGIRVEPAKAEFERHKARFEQLRQDVDIKLKLLDENKVRWMVQRGTEIESTGSGCWS